MKKKFSNIDWYHKITEQMNFAVESGDDETEEICLNKLDKLWWKILSEVDRKEITKYYQKKHAKNFWIVFDPKTGCAWGSFKFIDEAAKYYNKHLKHLKRIDYVYVQVPKK